MHFVTTLHPRRMNRRTKWGRSVGIALLVVLGLSNLMSGNFLVLEMVGRQKGTNDPVELLTRPWRDVVEVAAVLAPAVFACRETKITIAHIDEERLSDARTSTTVNIYAHAMPGADRDAADLLANILAPNQEDRTRRRPLSCCRH